MKLIKKHDQTLNFLKKISHFRDWGKNMDYVMYSPRSLAFH